jgi:hypothetical protein
MTGTETAFMTIFLRSEPPPPGATLLIHMGAGALDTAVAAAIRNYGEYRAVRDGSRGVFAVSVFAVIGGITEAEILAALPQRSFGRSTVDVIRRAGLDLFATSIDDPDLPLAVTAIQSAHFDVALPGLDDPRLAITDPLDDEDLEAAARTHLMPHVARLLALFEPRRRK